MQTLSIQPGELYYTRYPYWWNHTGTKELLELLMETAEWKFAKKEKEAPGSKAFVNLNYLNIPVSFDIEDTSFYDDGIKVSTMYVWQVGVSNIVFMGRTWDEFRELIDTISKYTDRHNRVIIYVHFLEHEFQFIRKMFTWSTVFSRKERSPIYAITTEGVEFRDSYILTGKSLAKSAEDIRTYKGMRKQVGDLDYTLLRGTRTRLTRKEIGYCMKDVQILNTLIYEKMQDENNNIGRIPLTNTGYVRRFVRELCMPAGKKHKEEHANYFNGIHKLTISPDEYKMNKIAFQGGFTHANAWYVGERLSGRIDSIDFTSSYPAVMVSNVFPASKGRLVKIKSQDQFNTYLKDFLSIFTVKFKNLRMKKTVYENIVSESKCKIEGDHISNNGRIVSADSVTMCITNVDFESIKQFYDYDCFYIGKMYVYKKGYLPKPIIEAVLDLYEAKTTLKGIPEKTVEYLLKKGMLNSTYGMMVTDIVKALVLCGEDGEWNGEEIPDLEEALEKYNNNKKRFNFYPWGVFITAYARRNLYSGILEFGSDYVYSDTDSIKCLNIDKHMQYIKAYNDYIKQAIDTVLRAYNIDPDRARPKNKKGIEKQLGVWDWETEKFAYKDFKTLGAKRYMYRQDEVDDKGKLHTDVLHITIAGVSKKMGASYISSQPEPFEFFEDGMTIDKEHSGKLTHTYLDYEQEGVMVDYTGKPMQYHELSSVHLEKASYTMSLTQEFKDYYTGVRYDND